MATVKGFPVEVRALSGSDGGGWLVTVPDLPGCVSDGDSVEEALQNVADAIEQWLETARASGSKAPTPGAVRTARKRLKA